MQGDGGIPAVNRLPVGSSVRLIVGEGHQGPCPVRQKKIAFLVPIAGQEVRQHVHLADARAPPLLDPPRGQRDLQAIAGQRVLQGERKILLGPGKIVNRLEPVGNMADLHRVVLQALDGVDGFHHLVLVVIPHHQLRPHFLDGGVGGKHVQLGGDRIGPPSVSCFFIRKAYRRVQGVHPQGVPARTGFGLHHVFVRLERPGGRLPVRIGLGGTRRDMQGGGKKQDNDRCTRAPFHGRHSFLYPRAGYPRRVSSANTVDTKPAIC